MSVFDPREAPYDMRDKIIKKNVLWDNENISKSNEVDVGKSLAKFGDILQELKKDIDSKETYPIIEIFQWVMNKHNIENIKGYGGHSLAVNKKTRYVKAMKKFKNGEMRPLQNKKMRFAPKGVACISFNDWQHNRNLFIESCSIMQNLRGGKVNNSKVRYKAYSNKSSWFYMLDYFFTHIKEYKLEKTIFEVDWQRNIKILNSPPSDDDKLYIVHRICKNWEALSKVIKWLNGGEYDWRRREIEKKHGWKHLTFFNLRQYGNTQIVFEMCNKLKKVSRNNWLILSYRQIKALVWVRDNWIRKFHFARISYENESIINFFFDLLKDFLADTKRYEERYDCLYIPNKTYRSLWL